MKWTAFTLDLSRIRKFVQNMGVLGKTFLILSTSTFLLFVLLGLAGYGNARWKSSPASSMKGIAASLSSDFFMDIIGLEVPHIQEDRIQSTFSQTNILRFVFRVMTDINPRDPKTMLAHEVPGLAGEAPYLLRKTSGTDPDGGPQDYPPPVQKDPNSSGDGGAASTQPSPSPTPQPSPTATPAPPKKSTDGKKVVMIYHSHNRESFLPELGIKDPNSAYDAKVNITQVGKRLADKLEELGVGAVSYNQDYTAIEKDFSFAYSYKYSGKTVKEAFAANPDIKFVFDLHRDSEDRKKTTTTINGQDYAQVFFIIGQKNPNWEKNEHFASQIQEKLEQTMPGLSKGIWGKTARDGNAEYNQSLSPNSVLIEIGGPYNTLEECYRTADVMAKVIADLYWDAEKVNAPAANAKSKS